MTAPQSQKYIENTNPANGQRICGIPDSGAADVDQAVIAAQAAFPAWSKLSHNRRFKIMHRLSTLIEENMEALAAAESTDSGKPFWLSKAVDIPRAYQNIRFFATAQMHFAGESHSMPGHGINYTLRQPIGIVGCISPWNLPLYLFTWKIAPALAAGNCVIAKPSEVTPLTAYLLSTLCEEAGLPAGVLNIIHGMGPSAGQAIIEHPKIKAISFTGGTKTGAHIAASEAPKFKKLSLELGGKNPNIIFADCDFDKMLETTLKSSFANNGQICLCGSRIYIQDKIYEKFKTAFLARLEQYKVGDPFDDAVQMGALSSAGHLEKVKAYIDLAQEEGGQIIFGGKQILQETGGSYLEPTVIEGLSNGARCIQEEIFGPVVTIMPFTDEAEALALANDSNYGLSSTIWTNDLSRAQRMAEQIQAGIVWINCWLKRDLRTAFGGVKQSGVGREGGWEALRFFTEPKNVCIEY